MKFTIILLLPLLIIVISCSSVRTNTTTKKIPPSKSLWAKKTELKLPGKSKQEIKPKSRFTDTAKVFVKPNIRTSHTSINSQLDTAIYNYEKASEVNDVKNMDASCLEIKSFAETFAEGDSLKFEALFYKCECLIYKQKFHEAEKELNDLIKEKQIPNSVLERSLIRLGQVYCALERRKEAQAMFAKFNKQFPNSIYKEIANCEAIRSE
ncbi:MAG: hypothetical protein HZB41_12255 [Ignavibacteriae bacterium]|nr:hypothetical protein [Ignavibacteriota bacterium]